VLKKIGILLLFTACFGVSYAQYSGFSIGSDIGLLRSFQLGQRFWSIGGTIQAQFHTSLTDGPYFWFSYYTPEKVKNSTVATGKSVLVSPYEVPFDNSSQIQLRQVSIGWRHYLKGTCNAEKSWNLYGFGGFGIITGKVTNTQSVFIDTTRYTTPVLNGSSGFKRLTVDLGLGGEVNLGGELFLYGETRCWIPASSYRNPYLFINKNAPLTGSFSAGIRVYFE